MKKTFQDFQDVSAAKDLLEQVEGGVANSGDKVALPGDKTCNWETCVQPLYGTVIDFSEM